MANDEYDIRIEEILHKTGDRIVGAEYIHNEERGRGGEAKTYRVLVKREEYDRLAANINKPTLPFDQFLKVLRPFMLGHHASEDIPEAFRLLDTDHSGTIDIGELAAFMPVIVPDGNPYMLLHHVQKVDQNHDYKLNLAEFTALINQGVGRDITLGRL